MMSPGSLNSAFELHQNGLLKSNSTRKLLKVAQQVSAQNRKLKLNPDLCLLRSVRHFLQVY